MKPLEKLHWLVWLLVFCIDSNAQNLVDMNGSKHSQLVAYSIHDQHVFSFTGNQASLSLLQSSKLGIYSSRHYMLPELNEIAMAVGMKTNSGNFGAILDYRGFSKYSQIKAGLAYGRKLGEKLSLGFQFNFNNISISGYGKSSSISIDVGTLWQLSDQLQTGFQVRNPSIGKKGKQASYHWPAIYRFGMGYQASGKFFIGATIEKQEEEPVNILCGFQYSILKQIALRAGVSAAVSSGWFGFSFGFKIMQLELIANYHPTLGISPGMTILLNFKSAAN